VGIEIRVCEKAKQRIVTNEKTQTRLTLYDGNHIRKDQKGRWEGREGSGTRKANQVSLGRRGP